MLMTVVLELDLAPLQYLEVVDILGGNLVRFGARVASS